MVVGDDRHSTLLRYLVAAELYLNAEQYANHPVLREAQSDNRMFTDHIDTIFSLLLTDESCDEFDRVRCKNSTVKFEARLTCRNFRWSSLIHLLALVNIMDRPIFSVYPSVNEGFRSLFHRIIYPVRQYNYSESNNNQPTFGIMWTRDGDLDSRQGFRFEPNHFALMVRPEEVTNVGNDQCMGDTDSMDYESFATSRDSINVDPDTLFVSDDTNDDTNLNHSSNMDIDINSIPVNLENSPIPDVIPIVNETEADADTATCVSSTNPDFLSHDVGDIFGSISSITDEQKHVFLKDHFFPDENYTDFIKQHITKGKQKRQYTLSFQRSWLTQYPWLVYSPKQQGGLCKFCVLFQPKNERIKNAVLVNRPFTNLSKATGKDGVLQTHANCQYHKESVSLSSEFLNNYSKPQESIQYKLSSINEKNYNLNCHILHKIVQTIVLCGKQNIALRGHRDDSTTPSQATNKGNFLAILNLLAKSDDTLKTHLESPGNKNAKYTSKTIQNEVIEIVGMYIRNKLTAQLKDEGAVFTIIADETTDVSNHEMLALCLRFVSANNQNVEIKEIFFDFVHLNRTSGNKIAQCIIDSLSRHGIDVNKCRGQGYDGAGAMSSARVGVQARIKEVSPLALYVHCNSHVLNLSIAAACKIPSVRNMIDSLNEVYLFFHNSPKRQTYFELVIERLEIPSNVKKIKGLCKTRWIERHQCYETFYELYTTICRTFEGILNLENAEALVDLPHGPWEWDRETRTKAQGLLHTMESSMFIVAFVTVKNCLEVIKPAAVKLQKREQDIYSAYQYIDNAKTTISQYRKDIDDLFRTWFKDAEALAALVGTEITKPRITGRQTNRANATSDSAEEYFRRNMAIPFSDHLDTEMKTRFQSQDRVGVELFGLLPSSSKSISDIEDFVKKLSFWKDDLVAPSSLRSELQLWNRFWEGKDPLPDSLLGCLNVADEDIFPNIRKLLIIGCTLPVTSCEAERSFSTLRRTKTYLRNSIGDERLAGLTLMNVHGDVDINIEDICKLFIQSHRRRMFKNSLLTAND